MSQPSSFLRVIESPQNPHARIWLALDDGRGLKKHKRFLLSGRKSVPEALRERPGMFESLLVTRPEDIEGWALPEGLDVFRLSTPLFQSLDHAGTGFPLLVGRVPELVRADLATPPQGLELICALGDPANLGALMRSAAAFGVSRVILMEDAAHPFHPKAMRAGANAQFALRLERGPGWDMLGAAAGPIFALDGAGENLDGFAFPASMRLILGEEGKGLPEGLATQRLAIATTGAVESLNATVAASLALFLHFQAHPSR